MANKKYNPMSKEFQDEARRLGLTGNQLTQKYREEGKIISVSEANDKQFKVINAKCKTNKEYVEKCAKDLGYKDYNEKQLKRLHDMEIHVPMSEPGSNQWFGIYIAENYIMKTFENPTKMPFGNPGYDWICRKGQKIESKARCLNYPKNGSPRFNFKIDHNNIADYFILSGWDNRESLTPLHIWIFYKNDIVRGNKFWKRGSIIITNTQEGLRPFLQFEVTNRLEKLKEICNKIDICNIDKK